MRTASRNSTVRRAAPRAGRVVCTALCCCVFAVLFRSPFVAAGGAVSPRHHADRFGFAGWRRERLRAFAGAPLLTLVVHGDAAHLMTLTGLTSLSLSHNRIETLAPRVIGSLRALRRLDVSHNRLQASDDRLWRTSATLHTCLNTVPL